VTESRGKLSRVNWSGEVICDVLPRISPSKSDSQDSRTRSGSIAFATQSSKKAITSNWIRNSIPQTQIPSVGLTDVPTSPLSPHKSSEELRIVVGKRATQRTAVL
jgi:hypothetical protein